MVYPFMDYLQGAEPGGVDVPAEPARSDLLVFMLPSAECRTVCPRIASNARVDGELRSRKSRDRHEHRSPCGLAESTLTWLRSKSSPTDCSSILSDNQRRQFC